MKTRDSDRSGSQQLYVMNYDGSNQRRISFGGGQYASPMWSPRGDLVAFTKGEFHSVKGHLFEVSPTEWKVDKQRSSGTTQDVQGGAVKIG